MKFDHEQYLTDLTNKIDNLYDQTMQLNMSEDVLDEISDCYHSIRSCIKNIRRVTAEKQGLPQDLIDCGFFDQDEDVVAL